MTAMISSKAANAAHPRAIRSSFQGAILIIAVPSLLVATGIDAYRVWRFNLPVVTSSLLTVGAALLAIAMLELGVFLVFVREVRLFTDRIVFLKGQRSITVNWHDLILPIQPYGIGLGFTYNSEAGLPSNEWLWVNRTVARAILTHPSCARDSVDSRVLRSVGL